VLCLQILDRLCIGKGIVCVSVRGENVLAKCGRNSPGHTTGQHFNRKISHNPRVIEIRGRFALAVHPGPCSTLESHWLQNRFRVTHWWCREPEFKTRGGFRGQVSKCSDIYCLLKPISWASNSIEEYWYVTKLASSFLWAWEPNVDPEQRSF